jgi:hypothetical protein
MDGITLPEVVRSYLRLQTLPVIVVSGEADHETSLRLEELKVARVFANGSFELNDLLSVIANVTATKAGCQVLPNLWSWRGSLTFLRLVACHAAPFTRRWITA